MERTPVSEPSTEENQEGAREGEEYRPSSCGASVSGAGAFPDDP
jgi:hypothetical protein